MRHIRHINEHERAWAPQGLYKAAADWAEALLEEDGDSRSDGDGWWYHRRDEIAHRAIKIIALERGATWVPSQEPEGEGYDCLVLDGHIVYKKSTWKGWIRIDESPFGRFEN